MSAGTTRHESLWIATTQSAPFAPLQEPIDVDVAVVGAGIAGLTTARLLKQVGLCLAVPEASSFCTVGTCYTAA